MVRIIPCALGAGIFPHGEALHLKIDVEVRDNPRKVLPEDQALRCPAFSGCTCTFVSIGKTRGEARFLDKWGAQRAAPAAARGTAPHGGGAEGGRPLYFPQRLRGTTTYGEFCMEELP